MKWAFKILVWYQRKKYDYYKTTMFMPAENFFNIIKTGDLRYMLKLKDYEKLPKIKFDLDKAWNYIYSQFLERTNGQDWAEQMNIRAGIERLRFKYFIISSSCFGLLINYDERFVKNLTELGYKVDIGDVPGSCEKILKSAQGILTMIELKKSELKDITKSELTIDDMLAKLDNHLGYHLNLKDITVDNFIGIKRNLENAGRKNNT